GLRSVRSCYSRQIRCPTPKRDNYSKCNVCCQFSPASREYRRSKSRSQDHTPSRPTCRAESEGSVSLCGLHSSHEIYPSDESARSCREIVSGDCEALQPRSTNLGQHKSLTQECSQHRRRPQSQESPAVASDRESPLLGQP